MYNISLSLIQIHIILLKPYKESKQVNNNMNFSKCKNSIQFKTLQYKCLYLLTQWQSIYLCGMSGSKTYLFYLPINRTKTCYIFYLSCSWSHIMTENIYKPKKIVSSKIIIKYSQHPNVSRVNHNIPTYLKQLSKSMMNKLLKFFVNNCQ